MLEVVVITYNQPKWLRFVLLGLVHQQTDHPFRVRVVNDGGGNAAADVVAEFQQMLPVGYYYLSPKTPQRRLSQARNLGVEKAFENGKAERVLCLDGDCVPGPAVVAEHARFGASKVVACGVRHRIYPHVADCLTEADVRTLDRRTYAEDDRFLTEPAWRRKRLPDVKRMQQTGAALPMLCHGFQASYPVREFRDVGGFCRKLPFRQDQDLACKLVDAGCTTILLPKAVCYHFDHPLDPNDPYRREVDAEFRARWGSR